ncbi:MAG: FAD synthetase family protein [Spirochaetaceae bacterium]|jgi:riboflavin kinase/FMN adenylyltransferase|nr:FAD synthetase family protein [Spirochaetaceae bacterium]
MRVIDWSETAPESSPSKASALTIGVFDGIHRGHEELIRRITAKNAEFIPTLITFRKNPKEFLRKKEFKGDILSLNQKLAIFERLSIALVVLIDFSENFSKLGGKEFLDLVRNRLRPGFVAVGSNFRCGYQGDTGAVRLKALYHKAGIPVDVVVPVLDGARPVSSSRIRSAIAAGDFSAAARLLGRNFEFDVSPVVPENRGGGVFYRTDTLRRVMPGPGNYSALLYGRENAGAVKAGVVVLKDGVLVPRHGEALCRIEFVEGGLYGPPAPETGRYPGSQGV